MMTWVLCAIFCVTIAAALFCMYVRRTGRSARAVVAVYMKCPRVQFCAWIAANLPHAGVINDQLPDTTAFVLVSASETDVSCLLAQPFVARVTLDCTAPIVENAHKNDDNNSVDKVQWVRERIYGKAIERVEPDNLAAFESWLAKDMPSVTTVRHWMSATRRTRQRKTFQLHLTASQSDAVALSPLVEHVRFTANGCRKQE